MPKAVLLDLDNTMILFDEMTYFKHYFARLGRRFEDLFAPRELQHRIVRATLALANSRGAMSNRERFMRHFADGLHPLPPDLWQRFERFYRMEYDHFGIEVRTPGGLHKTLEKLRQSGLQLVLATNPVYPLRAIEKRLGWGGIDPRDFALITHMENMAFVKPHLGYYRQICRKIGLDPTDCIMVGNDPVNDIIARNTGMQTYLTTEADDVDYTSLNLTAGEMRGPGNTPPPDFSGPFEGIAELAVREKDAGAFFERCRRPVGPAREQGEA
jgi:FMN phosphatase YigB (HAD superfamily)